jgi:hypothetical protein
VEETDIAAIDVRLQELLNPLKVEEEKLQDEKDTLRARLAEVDAAITRVRRVRQVAFPEPRPVVTRPKGSGSRPPGGYISEQKLNQIIGYFEKHAEPVTIPDLKVALGMSEPTISKGISLLRDQERIRLAGENSKKARLYQWIEPQATSQNSKEG